MGQPYLTSARAMLSTLHCAPTNSGLQVDFYVLMVMAKRSQSSPKLSFSLHFPIDLVWCPEPVSPTNGCRRLAGQCTKADSLAFASCPIEEHEHKTPAVRPCAMHECLTRKTSSIEISIQVAQLLHTGRATSIDRIERYEQSFQEATSQFLHDN